MHNILCHCYLVYILWQYSGFGVKLALFSDCF